MIGAIKVQLALQTMLPFWLLINAYDDPSLAACVCPRSLLFTVRALGRSLYYSQTSSSLLNLLYSLFHNNNSNNNPYPPISRPNLGRPLSTIHQQQQLLWCAVRLCARSLFRVLSLSVCICMMTPFLSIITISSSSSCLTFSTSQHWSQQQRNTSFMQVVFACRQVGLHWNIVHHYQKVSNHSISSVCSYAGWSSA